MKLRKLARQFAAAAVAGAMTLSLCMPALAETWNLSNQPDFKEVCFVTVTNTASGRTVELYGYDANSNYASSNYTETRETVLSDSVAARVALNGRSAPVRVALDELTTKLEIKSSSDACMSTAGNVTVDLRGDNTIQVTTDGAGIMLGGPLTISGTGTLHVGGPKGGIQVAKNTLTVAGGNLDVTNGGINVYGGTIQVSNDGSLNVASGNINANSGTVKVSNGYLNVATNDIQANGGTIEVTGEVTGSILNAATGKICANNGTIKVSGGQLSTRNGDIDAAGGTVEVTGGQLTASNHSVIADKITISGGEVTANTLNATGGDKKVKLSGSARVTLTAPLSADQVQNGFDFEDLTTEGWLKYKTEDESDCKIIYGTKEPPAPADTGTAPAGDVGGALAAVAIGGAAVWGGYEIATRVILHHLLPEGAAIPKTQAELALLLWNTAGSPEPASVPAYADVDDTTVKAAQWCAEQGYLTGTFQPEKHVAKYNVIRAWAKAFPKAG